MCLKGYSLLFTVKPVTKESETAQKTKDPIKLEKRIQSDMEAEEEAELRVLLLCPCRMSYLGNKRNLGLHVIVENNDSDVEDGERMKPVCNLMCLHQKGTIENER